MFSLRIGQLSRIFKIETSGGQATGVMCHDEVGLFLITAKHVIKNTIVGDKIRLFVSELGQLVSVLDIEHGEDDADVSVVFLGKVNFSPPDEEPLPIAGSQILLGEELLFAGFPLGFSSLSLGIEKKPTPLLRKGILSGFIMRSFNGDRNSPSHPQLVIDAINNFGFSGGPIIRNQERNLFKPAKLVVVGIVSEYLFDRSIGSDSGARPNSGFMIGIPIACALKAKSRIVKRLGRGGPSILTI